MAQVAVVSEDSNIEGAVAIGNAATNLGNDIKTATNENGKNLNEKSYVKNDGTISNVNKGLTTMELYVLSSLNLTGWFESVSAATGESYEYQQQP